MSALDSSMFAQLDVVTTCQDKYDQDQEEYNQSQEWQLLSFDHFVSAVSWRGLNVILFFTRKIENTIMRYFISIFRVETMQWQLVFGANWGFASGSIAFSKGELQYPPSSR